ncbi:hypothetical protein ACMZOO_00765 [Catenovulum sp. SX2]|uniref:hypothetical protein n=1 Tax=Catenovulum sp. SX2 TaxID=3398614 RepID=UPI003F82D08D
MEVSIIQSGISNFIESLSYNLDELVIIISLPDKKAKVIFNTPIAFKCLDEGDLKEYWHEQEITNNWLLEIKTGGWIEKELSQNGLYSSRNINGLTEFLVKGSNECVNILNTEQPTVLFE